MRALLPNLHALLGSLPLLLGLFFLTACTTDRKPPSDPPEINTYNAYVDEVNNTINYYILRNDALVTFQIATFEEPEEGFENVLFFNTDEEKQGFEYIAYVTKNSADESSINLFDLDKGERGQRYFLTTTNTLLCGITKTPIPSGITSSARKETSVSEKDESEIILQISSNSADCDDEIYYEKVDFTNLIDDDESNDRVINPEFIEIDRTNPLLVVDYGSNGKVYGYLNYNNDSSELTLNYVEPGTGDTVEHNQWSTQLPFDEPMSFVQASSAYVLFQQGRNLYVKLANELFTIDDVSSSSETPAQERIDALFSVPTMTLGDEYTDLTITTNEIKQTSSFVVEVENDLYIYRSNALEQIYDGDSSEDASLSYLLNSNDDVALVAREEGELDVFATIDSAGFLASNMFAEEIDISINRDTFYANTFNRLVDSGEDTGNEAHALTKVNGNFEFTSFENSTLIQVTSMTDENHMTLLLSTEPAENISGTRQLPGVYLYKFDASRENGRALAQSSRTNAFGRAEFRNVDFSFGIFDQLSNLKYQDGLIVNDLYGYLDFEATYPLDGLEQTADFRFVFDPSQETPDPDLPDQSLKLLLQQDK